MFGGATFLHPPQRYKFKAKAVFPMPWSETTEMQARPGAHRWRDFAQISDHGLTSLKGTLRPGFKLDSLRTKN